ncbi:MAG TPA: DNA-3-methyladenine glycosylase I, partial [Acidimicrobiales bacterium]|nr:DNA-3-methyladenine glycosylase I [Acidimicrobiales bacterium]
GRPAPARLGDLVPVTAESTALSKALRKLGFRFVGPTTAYAARESLGVVNDHLAGCGVRDACEDDRRRAPTPVRRE